jgi:hypothetical protein
MFGRCAANISFSGSRDGPGERDLASRLPTPPGPRRCFKKYVAELDVEELVRCGRVAEERCRPRLLGESIEDACGGDCGGVASV